MVQPSVAAAALVTWFQGIPAAVAQMGGNPANIYAHFYAYGEENSLAKAIGEMKPPATLITYETILGGQFDGSTLFKHRFQIIMKTVNTAYGQPLGPSVVPLSTPDYWWVLMTAPSTASHDPSQNILQGALLASGTLPFFTPPDIPSLLPRHDEFGDFFVGTLTFPELYD